MEIEKRTGWDWVIIYQVGDHPIEEMNVFGAMSIDEALRDAHQSLSACELMGIEPDYQILGVIRQDQRR